MCGVLIFSAVQGIEGFCAVGLGDWVLSTWVIKALGLGISGLRV